jgi:hypothetical protein
MDHCKSLLTSLFQRAWNALKGLEIKEAWIIAPVKESYPIA